MARTARQFPCGGAASYRYADPSRPKELEPKIRARRAAETRRQHNGGCRLGAADAGQPLCASQRRTANSVPVSQRHRRNNPDPELGRISAAPSQPRRLLGSTGSSGRQ